MRKYRCTECNTEWFSNESPETVDCSNDDLMNHPRHPVKEVKTLHAVDYEELWSSDLEDANRHSLTDMPVIIHHVLCKHISDRKVVRKIMKDLYNIGVGI